LPFVYLVSVEFHIFVGLSFSMITAGNPIV